MLYSQVIAVAFLFAFCQAVPLDEQHQATSFATFNNHHNTVHHVQSKHMTKDAIATISITHSAVEAKSPLLGQSYSSVGHTSSAPVAHHIVPAVMAQPVVHVVKAAPSIAIQHKEEEYAPAKYEFAYGVEDHHTGDIHSHKESRHGDLTQGEYSLHEADGTIRTVRYTVDKHSGFNAVVERSGHAVHVQPAKHH